jgi:serine/threonine protein kinase
MSGHEFRLEAQECLLEHGYELVEWVGSGTFAHVFVVAHVRYQELFCAKVIDLSIHSESQALLNTFASEVSALVKLSHPNIINMYDHWHVGCICYMILEYAEGGSLTTFVAERGYLSGQTLAHFIHQIVSALAYCHSNGICHRDIKPDNILIDRHGRPKLCDFGFSCQAAERGPSVFCGSLPFMSPEMLTEPVTDPFAADVWAAGVTIFFMATGRLPWASRIPEKLINEVARGAVVIPPEVPERIAYMLRKVFEPDPAKRPNISYMENSSPAKKLVSAGSLSALPLLARGRVKTMGSGASATFARVLHSLNGDPPSAVGE